MERIVQLARGVLEVAGSERPRLCLAAGEPETGAACRISSPLQAAGGSIFSPPPPTHPPPAPMGEDGGREGWWGLSRRRELKVNVRRHNGEGPPPPREGEARFRSPPLHHLRSAAPVINILQRSVWWVQQRRDGRLGEGRREKKEKKKKQQSASPLKFVPGTHKEPGRPRSRLQRANASRSAGCSFSELRWFCSALSARPALLPRCLFSVEDILALCSGSGEGLVFSQSCVR